MSKQNANYLNDCERYGYYEHSIIAKEVLRRDNPIRSDYDNTAKSNRSKRKREAQ